MTGLRADKRLRSDFTWVLAGNILYSACQWGIVVALAKLGSPEKVGEYALGMAISAPIVLFANLQLRALLASDVSGQFSFGQYLTFRLVTLVAALFVVAGAAVCAHAGWRLGGIIVLVGCVQALDFVSDTYYGLMQKHEQMRRISISLTLKGPLSLAALCGTMYSTHSVAWAVAGLMLGRVLILLIWDSRLDFAAARGGSGLEWNLHALLPLLRMALPLGVISMLASLNTSIPRYFIEIHNGSAELGIFSAIASLLSTGTLVVASFGQSIFLPVARACASLDRSKYRGYVTLAVALGGSLGGVAVFAATLFGREILTHVFRPEYSGRADILVRLMIAGTVAFIASGLGYIITGARSLTPQIPLLLAANLASAATSAWSIPRHGLSGATDAVLAGAVLQLIGTGAILLSIDRRLEPSSETAVVLPVRATPKLQRMGAETT
jgi:O-antigen/teichoic acid export membrane protein